MPCTADDTDSRQSSIAPRQAADIPRSETLMTILSKTGVSSSLLLQDPVYIVLQDGILLPG